MIVAIIGFPSFSNAQNRITSFVPMVADSASLIGDDAADHDVYSQIFYEHFQRAFGSGRNFGVARPVPRVLAELVECDTANVLAKDYADGNGILDFASADGAEVVRLEGLDELCVRMHGESRINENRTATRTLVTYGPAILGIENACDDDTSEGADFVNHRNRRMANYVTFFSARTSFFSMLGDPGRCTGEETYGPDYLTFETGGERAVRCDPMDEVARQFVEFAAAKTSPYSIYFPMIPSTTTASVGGQPVSWGADGWGTRDGSEGAFFTGTAVPEATVVGPGEPAAIIYSTWH